MKPRTLLALALTLAVPMTCALAAPGDALAQNKAPSIAKGAFGKAAKKGAAAKKDTPAPKPAAPAKDPAAGADKSPASDDIVLTKGAVSHLQKKMADTTDLGTDKSKLDSFKIALTSVQGGLKRIKAADPKWDVSAWESIVKEAEARLKKGEQAVAAKDAADLSNEHSYRDYVWKLSSVQDGMALLAELESKPNDVKIYSKDQIFGNMAKNIAGVEELDKDCKAKKYDKLTVIPPSYVKEIPAAEGCKRAAKWKELGKKFVELQARGGAAREVTRLQGVIDRAKKGEKIEAADHDNLLHADAHITRFKADYDKGGQAFGLVTEAAWYEPIKTVAATYPAALAEAEKTSRWDKQAVFLDQGTSSAVIKQHQKGGIMAEGQVIKTAARQDWSVETDFWKVPVSRSRSVDVLVKIKGETYCRLYSRSAGSSFRNGAWQPTSVGGGESTFRISACK